MDDADRREAYLRLGELYLLEDNGMEARRCFRQGLEGRLSTAEIAQAEYGIGRAYLLDSRPGLATKHLRAGLFGATGPGAEECRYLLALCEGETLAATPELLQRVQPYLPDEGMVASYAGAGSMRFLDVSRASWRAKPIRQNHELMGPPTRITIHHSAEPLSSRKLSDSRKEVLRIQSIHQDDKHWADIGYHFLIDPAGRVFEGRPIDVQGAHAGNKATNRGNIGICLLGNFKAQPERGPDYAIEQRPTSTQLASLEKLVNSLRGSFRIQREQVFHHGDFRQTECPGWRLRGWIRNYRSNSS
jgi:hypothetical protein